MADFADIIEGMHDDLLAATHAATQTVTHRPRSGEASADIAAHAGRVSITDEPGEGGTNRTHSVTIRMLTARDILPGDAIDLGGEAWAVESADTHRGKTVAQLVRTERIERSAAQARRARR